MENLPTEYHTDQERLLEPWGKEEKKGCLYFVSKLSLETQCALVIFSGLIQALAESTESLGKLTLPEVSGAHPDEAAHGCYLLYCMSRDLVASGLVSNIVEANAIIIPPFARRRLLDRGPDRQTTTADAPGNASPPQDSRAHDTQEAGQPKPEDGTAVEEAQAPQIEAKLDQHSAAIAPGGSSSQNVSRVDGTDEVTESTPEDGTVAEEAQMAGIELQTLHSTK
jgi:hypothetical protein